MDELNNHEISQTTQHKIQETLHTAAFLNLFDNQISSREKARLLSIMLPQSCAWLSAPLIPSLRLHLQPNEIRAALNYQIGVPLYSEERKCPNNQNGTLENLGDHALGCHGRRDMISRHDRVRYRIFATCSTQNLAPYANRKIGFRIKTQGQQTYTCPAEATSCVRCDHNFPTATQSNFSCGEEVWFCSDKNLKKGNMNNMP